jgi:ATP-dependent Clp protease protease subunit
MEIDLKESLRIKLRLNEIMARNTGQTLKRIQEDMERDYWMTAEDAKKYGLVDSIIKTLK